jgi:acyl-CoA thioesterase II
LADLVELITVKPLEIDRFTAAHSIDGWMGLYGGEVAAQAVNAAIQTVEPGRMVHSLHGYYLRRGNAAKPLTFVVDRDRDGRSYSARRVAARQDGKAIFTLSASFQVPQDGPSAQLVEFPDVASPDDSEPVDTHLVDFEVRDPDPDPNRGHPTRAWLRCRRPLPAEPNTQVCALVYASDLFSGLPDVIHIDGETKMASLDHAVWIHRPPRCDDWLLIDHHGVSVASHRGWYSSYVFDRDGVLVASIAQEMVIR